MNRNLLIGLLAIAAAAVGGFLAQRAASDRDALTATSPATSESAGAVTTPSDPEAGEDAEDAGPRPRAIPETLPHIELADREGRMRSLSEWKGRPLLVNFWATWCGPCRDEIPLLKDLRRQREGDRLEIVGIAIDQRPEVLKFAREIGIDYPILMGEQDGYEAAEAFGVALVLPFSVFADSQGRIVTLKVGELHADEADFILDRVRDVDANRLALEGARQQIADRLRDLAAERARAAAAAG